MNKLMLGIILVLGAIYFIGGYYSIAVQEASQSAALTASTGNIFNDSTAIYRSAFAHEVYQTSKEGQQLYLQFEPENNGLTGSAIMLFSDGCEYVYGYYLQKNIVELTYLGSTCSTEGKNTTLHINKNGSIATEIEGQTLIFKEN